MIEKKTVLLKDVDYSSIKMFETFGWVLVEEDKRKLVFERDTSIENYHQLKSLGDEYYFGKKKNTTAIWIVSSIIALGLIGIGSASSGSSGEGFAYMIGNLLVAPALIGFIPFIIVRNKDKKRFDRNQTILEEVKKLK